MLPTYHHIFLSLIERCNYQALLKGPMHRVSNVFFWNSATLQLLETIETPFLKGFTMQYFEEDWHFISSHYWSVYHVFLCYIEVFFTLFINVFQYNWTVSLKMSSTSAFFKLLMIEPYTATWSSYNIKEPCTTASILIIAMIFCFLLSLWFYLYQK